MHFTNVVDQSIGVHTESKQSVQQSPASRLVLWYTATQCLAIAAVIQNPRHVAEYNALKVEVLHRIMCAGVIAVETVDNQVMSMVKIDLWLDQSNLVGVPEQKQCIDVLPPTG